MRTSSLLLQRTSLALAAAALIVGALIAPSCSDVTAGGGGAGGSAGGSPTLAPGELCSDPMSGTIAVRAEPSTLFLPPCTDQSACPSRKLKLFLDPDVCASRAVTFSLPPEGASVVTAPKT